MDKIAGGILLISLLAIVFAVSLSYYILSQPNQTSNSPSPTPTPTSSPMLTPSPSETPTEPVTIPKPSVPEFSVRIVAYPYDVPPKTTTTIDQYTGKETTITQPGYHVENKSIEIIIKNPSFTPYTLSTHTSTNSETGESYTYNRNSTVNLYYNVGVKGHFGNDWKSVGSISSYIEGPQSNAQLDSEYTVIATKADDYPKDAVLDFRVQTLIGYYVAFGRGAVIMGYDFYGQESDWSDTQTITIP